MDTDTIRILEGAGLVAFCVIVLAILVNGWWQARRTERMKRGSRPVRAKVVESECRRQEGVANLQDNWEYSVLVTTRFESAGDAFTHERTFSGKQEALDFAAKYAVGTLHDVFRGPERGAVFLPDAFEKPRRVPLTENPAWAIAIPIGFLVFVIAALVKVARDAQ